MAFTGQLGTNFSQLGQILLGSVGSIPLTITVASNLNSWQDSTARQLNLFIQPTDTLSLSDSSRVVLGLNLFASDDANNLADAIETFTAIFYGISVGDTLNNWDDLIALFKENQATQQLVYKPSEVEYIRRYLNDVIIERAGVEAAPTNVIYKMDEITYIRRYLNDV